MGDFNIQNIRIDILKNYQNEKRIIKVEKKKVGFIFKKYKYIIHVKYINGIINTFEYNNYAMMSLLLCIEEDDFKNQIIKYNGKINNKGFIFFKSKKNIDMFDEYIQSLLVATEIGNML